MTAKACDEFTAQGLPVWEVQGYGTVTGAGREARPPWLDVRLTLPDGARVDVLAVVRGDTIAIEDAQADPPLPLASLGALSSALHGPLEAACASVMAPASAYDSTVRTAPPAPPSPAIAPEPATQVAPVASPIGPAPEEQVQPLAAADGPVDGDAPPSAAPAVAAAAGGRHRGHGAAGRRGGRRGDVVDAYRAAQSRGEDPVLAVMAATGFGRRRTLRLIAGARDAGHLPSRRRKA
nr:DUF6214 family protein [Streptomyces sp. NRRL F-5126]